MAERILPVHTQLLGLVGEVMENTVVQYNPEGLIRWSSFRGYNPPLAIGEVVRTRHWQTGKSEVRQARLSIDDPSGAASILVRHEYADAEGVDPLNKPFGLDFLEEFTRYRKYLQEQGVLGENGLVVAVDVPDMSMAVRFSEGPTAVRFSNGAMAYAFQ